MNYKELKGVIDGLVNTHKCPDCSNSISEKSIDIIGAAGKTINIDIACSNCGKHSMVKAEIAQIDVSNLKVNDLKNGNIKNEIIKQLKGNNQNNKLNESDISNLDIKLKKSKISANDLFQD